MQKEKRKYTTISISHEAKKELDEIGTKAQSYDDLIKELVNIKKAKIEKALGVG